VRVSPIFCVMQGSWFGNDLLKILRKILTRCQEAFANGGRTFLGSSKQSQNLLT